MKSIDYIRKSISSRIIYPWLLKNFRYSNEGIKLRKQKNAYSSRCFFVGNGPSLHSTDLDVLFQNQEITFAFNRIYNIFDQTKWRPTYYISQDHNMLAGCIDEVNRQPINTKFIPIQLKWYKNLHVNDAIYFNIVHQDIESPDCFLFSDDITQCIYNSSTVMYTAAQIAAYMGFTEVYLIGVDHHFQISKNNSGEIIIDNSAKDYFSDKYNSDKEHLDIPNTEKSTLTYIAMKHHCDQRGIKVYNATRGGKLEVFPRVDFDDLFKD